MMDKTLKLSIQYKFLGKLHTLNDLIDESKKNNISQMDISVKEEKTTHTVRMGRGMNFTGNNILVNIKSGEKTVNVGRHSYRVSMSDCDYDSSRESAKGDAYIQAIDIYKKMLDNGFQSSIDGENIEEPDKWLEDKMDSLERMKERGYQRAQEISDLYE
jgi:hypothetical protein